jgi:hypothetical protein
MANVESGDTNINEVRLSAPGLHISIYSPLVQRDDLAVDHRFVGYLSQRLDDCRVFQGEVFIVAGSEVN